MYDIRIENDKWWEDKAGFFGSTYLEADNSFDGFLSNNKELSTRTDEEINGVIKLCQLKKKDAVLDCPCGYGRHSVSLAQKGLKVTGCDINSEFLKICQEKKSSLNLENFQTMRCKMQDLKIKNKYNAVINMFYSFGFFEDEKENIQTARNFYNSLKNDGKFLMHTHVTVPKFKKKLIKEFELRNLKSGGKLELYRFFNEKTKREDGRWTVISPEGERKEMTHYSVRIYDTKEYTELCKEAGFKDVKFYGDWQGSPYKDESDLLIAVAEK